MDWRHLHPSTSADPVPTLPVLPPAAAAAAAAAPPRNKMEAAPLVALWSLVARKLNKSEIAATPKAKAAMQAEWDRLQQTRKVWGIEGVREWDGVFREAGWVRPCLTVVISPREKQSPR